MQQNMPTYELTDDDFTDGDAIDILSILQKSGLAADHVLRQEEMSSRAAYP